MELDTGTIVGIIQIFATVGTIVGAVIAVKFALASVSKDLSEIKGEMKNISALVQQHDRDIAVLQDREHRAE